MGLLHRSTGIEQLSKRVQAGHYAGDFFGSVGFDVSGMTQSRKVPCFDVGTQCGALRIAAARSGREFPPAHSQGVFRSDALPKTCRYCLTGVDRLGAQVAFRIMQVGPMLSKRCPPMSATSAVHPGAPLIRIRDHWPNKVVDVFSHFADVLDREGSRFRVKQSEIDVRSRPLPFFVHTTRQARRP